MRLHRATLTTTRPTERGREYAVTAGTQIHATVHRYLRHYASQGATHDHLRAVAQGSLDMLATWSPEQAAELHGTAAELELPTWQLMALLSRTEVLSELTPHTSECTTVVILPGDGPTYSLQTWDWDPALAPEGLHLEYALANGMQVSTFTEFGMTAKIGVNSAGLGLHFNILHHRQDRFRPGIPVHCIAREVLARATSVAQAQEIIDSASATASSVLTVTTANNARSIEISPAGVAALQPVKLADAGLRDRVLWHTNHFLDPGLASGELPSEESTTHQRAAHVDHQLRALAGATPDLPSLAGALCGSAGASAPVCMVPDSTSPGPWATLLTASITLDPPLLSLHAGTPASAASHAPTEEARCFS